MTDPDALTGGVNREKASGGEPTVVSDFAYVNDDLGRRSDMGYVGTPFTAAASYEYLFNTRGGVAVANFTGAATATNRAYAYDEIGNRHWESQGHADLATVPGSGDTPGSGTRTDYTADALNQYASITGMSPSYDGDGNLLADGDFAYSWDAENRLVAAEPDTVAAGDRRLRLGFEYDYLGRRVGWLLEDANTGATVTHLLMQWDGWNLVATYLDDATETDELHCTWTWGPDLSGSLQGAGGVGGLLAQHKRLGAGSYVAYPCYDGNGNIWQYVKRSDGSAAAKFEYDAFGNVTASSGADAAEFRFRFSTKWQETDALDASAALALGWNYYGYRYYDPQTGRWPSRDPIGEQGGVNLYGFVGNDGIDYFDRLGTEPTTYSSAGAAAHAIGSAKIDEEYEKAKQSDKEETTYQPREWGGRICEKKTEEGCVYTTTEVIGEGRTVKVALSDPCSELGEGWILAGWWHTHPGDYLRPLGSKPAQFTNPPWFSGTDMLSDGLVLGKRKTGDTDWVDSNVHSERKPLTVTRKIDGIYETSAYIGESEYLKYRPDTDSWEKWDHKRRRR